ncbi:STAS domain-containing protein [Streptomyces sp. WAC07149]|nr:STAS domain-containing protein [Streptomyces sp. WAC07149]
MITMGVQRCGSSVLAAVSGDLDEGADSELQEVLDGFNGYERDLMIDVHAMRSMDVDGLLHLLELHRRAEHRGVRVLVVGWQPQPQQLMAQVAGIHGPGTATGDQFALAGFRRLIEERAHRARNLADLDQKWQPHA